MLEYILSGYHSSKLTTVMPIFKGRTVSQAADSKTAYFKSFSRWLVPTIFEPAQIKRDLIVFRFVVLQMRIHSPLFGLQTCVFCLKVLLHVCEQQRLSFIMKTYLYNFDPLKPHFYTVKLGFTGVYIIFLISDQKHRLWVLVRTASVRRF